MIKETLSLLGRIDMAEPGDAIVLLDGDSVEVNIIRNGERMTLLNLSHFEVTEEGERVPIEPLAIKMSIERAQLSGGAAKKRPAKAGLKKPRKAAVGES